MIFYLILAGIAILMVWYLLVTIFWIVMWLAIQPVRLVIWAAVALKRSMTSAPAAPPLPSNVVRFPSRRP